MSFIDKMSKGENQMQMTNKQQLKFDHFSMGLFLSLTLDECLRFQFREDEDVLQDFMIEQIITAGERILGLIPEA